MVCLPPTATPNAASCGGELLPTLLDLVTTFGSATDARMSNRVTGERRFLADLCPPCLVPIDPDFHVSALFDLVPFRRSDYAITRLDAIAL